MGDHHLTTARRAVVLATGLVALIIGGCASGVAVADPSAAEASPIIAEMSLMPASDAVTPEAIPSAEALPSTTLPSGDPSVPAVAPPEYDLGADDLAAFVDAYAAAFPEANLTADEIDLAGSRLCTYLMRHADADDWVDAANALSEADVSEPGYARETWVAAFELALANYCGEFSADFETEIGG